MARGPCSAKARSRPISASGQLSLTSAPVHVSVTYLTVTEYIPRGGLWKYLDTGTDQGSAWTGLNFNDQAWAQGPAQLGYGGDDEATVVGFGPNSANRYITTYFRRWFSVPPDAGRVTNLTLRLQRDDGAVVWLDGVELFRSNMPQGAISYVTLAASTISGAGETTFYETPLNSLVVAHQHVVSSQCSGHGVEQPEKRAGLPGRPEPVLQADKVLTHPHIVW